MRAVRERTLHTSLKVRRPRRATHFQQLALQCVEACVVLEAECRRALIADATYSHSCDPLGCEQLCLVACADACRVTISAIVRREAGLHEVCSWCAELCQSSVQVLAAAGASWAAVTAAGEQSAAHCSDLSEAVTKRAPAFLI